MSLIRALSGIAAAAPPSGAHPDFPDTAYDLPGNNANYLRALGDGFRSTINGASVLSLSFFFYSELPTNTSQPHLWQHSLSGNTAGPGVNLHDGAWQDPYATRLYGRAVVGGNAPLSYSGPNGWIEDTPHHAICEFDFAGGFNRMWIDGNLIMNEPANFSSTTLQLSAGAENCGIGCRFQAGTINQLKGWMVQLGHWVRALSAGERDSLATGINPSTVSGCVGEYSLNPNDAGGGLVDTSGSGSRTITMTGSLGSRPTTFPS